jgi:hypothetical protein
MGYFSDLIVDIMDMHNDGWADEDIAAKFDIPVTEVSEIVRDYADENYDADPGEMDGDFDSAMASAGFGTDEDYGYYGEE